jgi:DNA-binding GntR family transcriptional regulator
VKTASETREVSGGVSNTGVNKESLSEQIYRAILVRITTLQVRPGERINLDKLKEEFSVSTAPIREALQRLAQNDLVVVKPRIGFFAVNLSRTQVTDIFNTRKMLESYCLRQSINVIPAEQVASLRAELEDLRRRDAGVRGGDGTGGEARERFERLDLRLHHELIVGNCTNEYIRSFYRSLSNFSAIIRHIMLRIPADSEEHMAILDALADRDLLRAEEALLVHLSNTQHATVSRLPGTD